MTVSETRLFEKTVDTTDRQAMIDFLSNHFRYDTLSSWNAMTSYANNVKLHKLNIPAELDELAWDVVCGDVDTSDLDFELQMLIDDFTHETGWTAGFNGRSNGYLVLYDTKFDPETKRRRTLCRGVDMDGDFEDWDDDQLRERVEIVCAFDRLCDDMRDTFVYHLQNGRIETVTRMVPLTERIFVTD